MPFYTGDIIDSVKAKNAAKQLDESDNIIPYLKNSIVDNSVNRRTMKLTNEPVSDELNGYIDNLLGGKYIGSDEVGKTKEIQFAEQKLKEAKESLGFDVNGKKITSTHELPIEARKPIRDNTYNTLMNQGSYAGVDESGKAVYNGVVNKNKRLDIVIGLPASGKSSAIVDKLSAEYGSKLIDNDQVKELIPEFNDGWGSSIVHKESQNISNQMLKDSLYNGENIVLPKVGAKFESINDIVDSAKDAGYNVNIHYADLPPAKSYGRMINRFVEDGRYLPYKLMDDYSNADGTSKIDDVYEALKKGDKIDGYSKWSTDVASGEPAKLIESGAKPDTVFGRVSSEHTGSRGGGVGVSPTDARRISVTETTDTINGNIINESSAPGNMPGVSSASNFDEIPYLKDNISMPESVANEIPTLNIKPEEPMRRIPTLDNAQVADGELKARSYDNKTLINKTDMPDEVKNEFINNPDMYNVLSNKTTKETADRILANNSFDGAYAEFSDMLSAKNPVAIPLGYDLAKQAAQNGNTTMAVDIVESMSKSLMFESLVNSKIYKTKIIYVE